MHIIIIEDEPPIADEIEGYCRSFYGDRIKSIRTFHTLEDSLAVLDKEVIDLCLLDLNLHGQNGFEILKSAVSRSFQTIVISAYTDQAIDAFDFGVLDFVPKPFGESRINKAFQRYLDVPDAQKSKAKFLVTRKHGQYHLIPIKDIILFKAEGYLVEALIKTGEKELFDKSLTQLEKILPPRFIRVHRSYIVDLNEVQSFQHDGGGVYHVTLKNKSTIPLGRKHIKNLKSHLIK